MFGLEFRRRGLRGLEGVLFEDPGEVTVNTSSALEHSSPMPRDWQVSFPHFSFGTPWSHPFCHWGLTCPGPCHGFQINSGLTLVCWEACPTP